MSKKLPFLFVNINDINDCHDSFNLFILTPSITMSFTHKLLNLNYSLDCKEGHMKKIRLFVCLHRGQKNIDLRTHL